MTERLRRTASGSRHVRWAREVLATIGAHLTHNDRISEEQRTLLVAEQTNVQTLISTLIAAVGDYSSFLETGFIQIRAELRVANYLVDEQMLVTQGTLLPYRSQVAKLIAGGISAIFSRLSMSRVLRAGNARAARLAHTAAAEVAKLSGVGGMPDLTGVSDRLDLVGDRVEQLLERLDEEIEPQRRPLKLAVERAVLELREGLEHMDARLRARFTSAFIESLYPELSKGARAVANDANDEDDDDTEDVES